MLRNDNHLPKKCNLKYWKLNLALVRTVDCDMMKRVKSKILFNVDVKDYQCFWYLVSVSLCR